MIKGGAHPSFFLQIKEVKEVVGEEDHYTYISFGANI